MRYLVMLKDRGMVDVQDMTVEEHEEKAEYWAEQATASQGALHAGLLTRSTLHANLAIKLRNGLEDLEHMLK